ncbi:hypothetical protein C0Q70_12604 [Pomacea canaliculata]|uniref:Kringle domain-containing protein n=1 Tax=Pomacea canaliculata TaxID=400727 RepID=A0A2T7P1Z3_POMCA|nr:hypothetical protein C0Q70_12604 [Pomacea canaliculata]
MVTGCGLRPTVWQRTAVTYTGTNHGDVANYSCRYARRVCEGHHHHLLHQRRVADADYSVCTCKATVAFASVYALRVYEYMFISSTATTCWYTHWTWGQVYKGTLATTQTGLQCMSWSSDSPHDKTSIYKNDDSYIVDGGKAAASNYCRTFNDDFPGVWCYTTNPSTRWEPCSVPACPPS